MSIDSVVGKTCPYCQTPIKEADNVIVCPGCNIPHHRQCWDEGQGCTTFGCTGRSQASSGYNDSHRAYSNVEVGQGNYQTAAAQTRFCPRCGTQLAAGSNFCTNCGNNLGVAVQQVLQSNPNSGGMMFPYVGFWRRFVAYIIDILVLWVAAAIMIAVFGPGAYLINLFIGWLYFALLESSEHQGTLGKMAIGAKVIDYNGQRISFGKATGRYFGKILSGLILGIGYIMVGATAKKQGLHDMMAGTYVINK